ncbi:MAG: hypothetical protein M1142_01420 [Patescibacteria group bacterium]|nr:hypothetical protein [Patescibacteria group bacterium]
MSGKEALPIVPKPFKIITGEDETIQQITDNFFQNIIDTLGYKQAAADAFTEKIRQPLGIEKPSGFIPSDNWATYLRIRGYTVASVLELRDDLNYVEVLFAHYLTIQRIKNLRKGFVDPKGFY